MSPKLKLASELDEIYRTYRANIDQFLQKKEHVDNEPLLTQVKKELDLKQLQEKQIMMDNKEIWRQWFKQKQIMQAEMARLAEIADHVRAIKQKEIKEHESFALDFAAYKQLLTQDKSGMSQTSQTAANAFNHNDLSFDFGFTTNINQLIKNGVVSKSYVDKLLARAQDSAPSIRENAQLDLDYLQRPDVYNTNKTLYSQNSDAMEKDDKIMLSSYLDSGLDLLQKLIETLDAPTHSQFKDIYIPENVHKKNERVSRYFSQNSLHPRQANGMAGLSFQAFLKAEIRAAVKDIIDSRPPYQPGR